MSGYTVKRHGGVMRDGAHITNDELQHLLDSHGPLLEALKKARRGLLEDVTEQQLAHLILEIDAARAAAEGGPDE